jgi:RimJ/RimL family protein N-acetyltransferase
MDTPKAVTILKTSMPAEFRTSRLEVKLLRFEDIEVLAQMLLDNAERFGYWLGMNVGTRTKARASARARVRATLEIRAGRKTDSEITYGVWIGAKRTRRLVGIVGLSSGGEDGTFEVGFGLDTHSEKKGIASEAVQGLAYVALSQPGVNALAMRIDATNQRSLAVAERLPAPDAFPLFSRVIEGPANQDPFIRGHFPSGKAVLLRLPSSERNRISPDYWPAEITVRTFALKESLLATL